MGTFQSLSGIFGFWHEKITAGAAAKKAFQSLSGIFGFWHHYAENGDIYCGKFQSLSGIFGFWHIQSAVASITACTVSIPFRDFWVLAHPLCRECARQSRVFQSLSGIFGFWHLEGKSEMKPAMRMVSIPFRDFWVLARKGWAAGKSWQLSFNPFQGFLGSGTPRLFPFWVPSIFVSIPFRDFWVLAPGGGPGCRRGVK